MRMRTNASAWRMGWAQQFGNRWHAVWQPAMHRQPQTTLALPKAQGELGQLTLRTSRLPGQAHAICLAVEGEINRSTYLNLIETASLHYQQGGRWLLLDLSQTTQIELTGLFALLSIARLYSGQALLDPEAGWVGLHAAAASATPGLGARVKLLAPAPVAVAALARASFCRFFPCYPDLDTAVNSVGQFSRSVK